MPEVVVSGRLALSEGEIVKAGIVPEADLTKLLETKEESHDEVVFAVRDKKADVGTVRNNLLETMQREGKINMQDFFGVERDTASWRLGGVQYPLYPDWPVASLGKTPPDVANKLTQALLELPPKHPALVQARKIEHSNLLSITVR